MSESDAAVTLPQIPDLEFRAPDCPLCGQETNPVDDCFDCEDCEFTWNRSGECAQRFDPETVVCTAEEAPYADQTQYPNIQGNRYRCVREEGHDLPHRGVRVDESSRYIRDTHEWRETRTAAHA